MPAAHLVAVRNGALVTIRVDNGIAGRRSTWRGRTRPRGGSSRPHAGDPTESPRNRWLGKTETQIPRARNRCALDDQGAVGLDRQR
jgi:hypothetical protein